MKQTKKVLKWFLYACCVLAGLGIGSIISPQIKVVASGITQQAYNLIQNSGSPLIRRTTINCTGSLTCSDSGGVTVFNASGGSGGTAGSPLAVQTSSVTVTSNSETSLIGSVVGSLTVPANWFTSAGTVMEVCASGIMTTAAAAQGTVNFKLKFGTTVVAQTGAFTPTANLSNNAYDFCVRLTARTVGASGTVMATNIFPLVSPGLATPDITNFTNPTPGTAVTVDTTATQALDLTVTFSANATNSITQTNFYMVGPGSAVSSVGGQSGAIPGTGTGNAVFSASPTLTGSPLAPTQSPGDNSTKIATTAYVDNAASWCTPGVNVCLYDEFDTTISSIISGAFVPSQNQWFWSTFQANHLLGQEIPAGTYSTILLSVDSTQSGSASHLDLAPFVGVTNYAATTFDTYIRFKFGTATNANYFMGFIATNANTFGESAPGFIGVAYKAATDSNFMCVTRTAGGTPTRTSTGVAVDTSLHTARIRSTVAGTVKCSIDGGAETSVSTTVPTAFLIPSFENENTAMTQVDLTLDWWRHRFDR